VSEELRASDLRAVREQLGREPTVPFSVVARCSVGHPLVIRNRPLDAEDRPFPTTYWLTCPDAVRRVSALESDGWIARLNDRYDLDEGFRRAVEDAHAAYAAERGALLPGADGWGGVGGTGRKIKCLHAHLAFHLAGGNDPVGREVAGAVEQLVHGGVPSGRVGAIDQGTNSTRLLVLEPRDDGEPMEVCRDMVITRLGQDVDETGRLAPAAIDRATRAIERYARRARAQHVDGRDRLRIGATSAVRDAADGEAFLARVRALVDTDPELIDGAREASLSFLGGTRGLDPAAGPFLLVDVGGGSTELVFGREPGTAERSISMQIGSVRLTERVGPSDPPTEADLEAFVASATTELEVAAEHIPVGEARTFVAVAGTATTLQACALGLDRYDPDLVHRSTLTLADAERTLRALAVMTNEERAAIPVMPPGRGDVIVAGATILVEAMRRYGFPDVLVSETDILDGLALELLGVR
jgi:exopolyphosphatase / guanosine-5'-triphosphate,3'-diphosphate pyrophosphatase